MVWSQCEGTQSWQHLLAATTILCFLPISLFPFPQRPVGVARPFPDVSNVILFGLNAYWFDSCFKTSIILLEEVLGEIVPVAVQADLRSQWPLAE